MKQRWLPVVAVLLTTVTLYAQTKSADPLQAPHARWHLKDRTEDNIPGMSVDKAYRLLLADKPPQKTIVVAIIDSGVDIDHEDLQGVIWVNEDEIPNNQIDDDHNGYVDDIHGWNFIGNAKGQNITYENLELTRLLKTNAGDTDKAALETRYQQLLQKKQEELASIEKFEKVYEQAKGIIRAETGIMVTCADDLDKIKRNANMQVRNAEAFLRERYKMGLTEKGLKAYGDETRLYIEKFLNKAFNPRDLVGDNPNDITDLHYGNPDVEGPRANHGTSVAGIVAARRGNGVGMDGIADQVRIMCLRSTPHGDERDKDVALAIRYAVENGAQIINMSFGKDFSPQKAWVDEAVKFAAEHHVLLVHAAGNDGNNLDKTDNFPNNQLGDGHTAPNWITVGASTREENDRLAAAFSNYSHTKVDVFAPGDDIVSLDSSSHYSEHDGTSLAAPMVTGVAALILSRYPTLRPAQLVDIIRQSAYVPGKLKVIVPGQEKDKVKFTELSKSGGIVDAYQALLLAEQYATGKKP